MKILILNNKLIEQVISNFPQETLVSKRTSPVISYRYQINHEVIEITCLNELGERSLLGLSPDLIYCTHEDYRKATLQLVALSFCNPKVEIRIVTPKL